MSDFPKGLTKVFIGSDHAGFELKQKLIERFQKLVIFEDCGTNSTESCDYPVFAKAVSEKVLKSPGALGLLICGTGIGMSIAANKVKGIRAACVSEAFSAKMAREHNDAQILCLGARVIGEEKAAESFKAFLDAKLDTTNPRHQRRIELMKEMEK